MIIQNGETRKGSSFFYIRVKTTFLYEIQKGRYKYMVLFSILAVTLLLLLAIIIFAVGTVGAGVIVVFGDVIVCVIFIVLIMKRLIRRKR